MAPSMRLSTSAAAAALAMVISQADANLRGHASSHAGFSSYAGRADFGLHTEDGGIRGIFEIEAKQEFVEWETSELEIDASLVAKVCGKLMKGRPTFNYHLHTDWNFPANQKSSVGDCTLANVGNHWDPTAACGPASGNPVCDEDFCGTRGDGYTCDAAKFDPSNKAQYRELSPSPLFPKAVTCEFGDFSGMAGPIEGNCDSTGNVKTEVHDGKAVMAATFGEISQTTIEKPCSFGSLAKAAPSGVAYSLASVHYPLDQLPKNASVLVHCGNNYENANARFFCAKLH